MLAVEFNKRLAEVGLEDHFAYSLLKQLEASDFVKPENFQYAIVGIINERKYLIVSTLDSLIFLELTTKKEIRINKLHITQARYVSGLPKGRLVLTLDQMKKVQISDIGQGLVSVMLSNIKRQHLGNVPLTDTRRGQATEEYDKDSVDYVSALKERFFNGEISQLEFDDANPFLGKAGK